MSDQLKEIQDKFNQNWLDGSEAGFNACINMFAYMNHDEPDKVYTAAQVVAILNKLKDTAIKSLEDSND